MHGIVIHLSGQVQGVGLRRATHQEADQQRLVGFVRNLPDGRVEIRAEGNSDALGALLAWCRTSAPGHVVLLKARWQEPTGAYGDFSIVA